MPPTFALLRNGRAVAEISLGDRAQLLLSAVTLSETHQAGFLLTDPEPDTTYAVWIGDTPVTLNDGADPLGQVGRRTQREVEWPHAAWFESAMGRVIVALSSRHDTEDRWRERANIEVAVQPSKLGEARYRVMLQSLTQLTAGLVIDVYSKTTRSLRYGDAQGGVTARPATLEVQLLERTWKRLDACLQDIARAPEMRLIRRQDHSLCWGSERLAPASIARLASCGIDPGKPGAQRPFVAVRERMASSTDTPEHRAILAFLHLLSGRIHDCCDSLDYQVARIEEDRRYRDISFDDGPTLFQREDVPRITRLLEARQRADALRKQVDLATRRALFRGVRSELGLPSTPTFQHVVPYRRVHRVMSSYVSSSLTLIEQSTGDIRLKATSRLYEHWVLLQVIQAFREEGFVAMRASSLFRHNARRLAFAVDLDRGACVEFVAEDGRLLRITYEPWIFARDMAQQRHLSLYRGSSGHVPWSPDIVIELLSTAPDEKSRITEWALALDVKYTREVRDTHWIGVKKYREMRATRNRKQVVKQVWIAYPGSPEEISLADSDVEWTTTGPNVAQDESIEGVLAIVPPESIDETTAGLPARPVVRQFVAGLCAHLHLAPQQPVARATPHVSATSAARSTWSSHVKAL